MRVLDFINSLFVLKTKEQAVLIGTIMGLKTRSERKAIEKSNPMPKFKAYETNKM